RGNGTPHAHDRTREQLVGARGARAVDVGEPDDEVVYAADRAATRHLSSAWVMSMRYFFMSQAPVGQRSAHSPQCRHTSSSFTMMRPVFSGSETYTDSALFCATPPTSSPSATSS